MQPPDKQDMANRNRRWRQLAQWAILLGYILVIYWMGSMYWGVTRVAEFITIFTILAFVVFIAYRALEAKEK